MTRLLFALTPVLAPVALLVRGIAINGVSEERFRLVMDALDTAFRKAGMLTGKERYMALGIDAPRWSRILAGDEHLSIHRIVSVPNAKFHIVFWSTVLFALAEQTAKEIAEDCFRRRA